jgi:2-oxoglutaroyl-CoA hydrolase
VTQRDAGKNHDHAGRGHDLADRRKGVIVANRGYGFGVGFEFSLACDFRIASETAFYALPEQKLGQIPGSGGSARLQKMIGITRTKDIVMRSKRIPAKQAYDWGIVTECVPDADLEEATDALVDELRTFSPLAQRTAKKLLNDTEDSTLAIAIELEGHCYSRLRQSDDFKEGVEAFNSKCAPKYLSADNIGPAFFDAAAEESLE